MKIVVALCLVASASAFVPQSVALARAAARSVATEPEQGEPPAAAPGNSIAMPFMSRPALLDGTLAGDVGFDPLGFADNPQNLQFYAQAEIKHARLAMLCAAGWPLSELMHKGIAESVGAEPLLAAGGRAPSVLNGGLFDKPNGLIGLAALVGLASAFEMLTDTNKRDGWGETDGKIVTPGEFNFDPIGLYGKTDAEKKAMRTKEIKNGRVAMMAVLAYVGAEAMTGKPVTELTPVFFKPIWVVVMDAMNGGAAAAPAVAPAATFEPVAPVAPVAAPAPVAEMMTTPEVAPVAQPSPAVSEYVGTVYSDMLSTAAKTPAAEYAAEVYDDMLKTAPALAAPENAAAQAVAEPIAQAVQAVAEPVTQAVQAVAEPVTQVVQAAAEPVTQVVQAVAEPVTQVAATVVQNL